MHNLNLILRKHQTNPNSGAFCKITEQCEGHKRESRLRNSHRLKKNSKTEQLNATTDPSLILEREKDISGKTGEIPIGSVW